MLRRARRGGGAPEGGSCARRGAAAAAPRSPASRATHVNRSCGEPEDASASFMSSPPERRIISARGRRCVPPAGESCRANALRMSGGRAPASQPAAPGPRSVESPRISACARISMAPTATRRRRLRTPMAVDRPRSRTAASRRACAI